MEMRVIMRIMVIIIVEEKRNYDLQQSFPHLSFPRKEEKDLELILIPEHFYGLSLN